MILGVIHEIRTRVVMKLDHLELGDLRKMLIDNVGGSGNNQAEL